MKTNILSKFKVASIYTLLALTLGASNVIGASGKNTAAHIKAKVDDYEGKNATLDVLFVRAIQEKHDLENQDLWVAATADDDERSGGGGMLVVSDAEDRDKIVRKYGTNIERNKGKGPELNSMRGTVRKYDLGEGHRPIIYLDLTDAGFEPSEVHANALKIGNKHTSAKKTL